MHRIAIVVVAAVVLAAGSCATKSDGVRDAAESPNGASNGAYTQSELPFKLHDAANTIAVSADGNLAAIETAYNGEPNRLMLMRSGADSPTQFRVRTNSQYLTLGDEDVIYLSPSDGIVASLKHDSDAGQELPFGLDPEMDSIKGLTTDRSRNVYALVERDFKYRVLMLKPGAKTAEGLPFGEVEDVDLMATTSDGAVVLITSPLGKLTTMTLDPGAAKPTVVDAPGTYDFDFVPLAIGPDHSLYFFDDGSAAGKAPLVTVLDKHFTTKEQIPVAVTQGGKHKLAVDGNGNLYLTDDNRIFRLAKS